MTISQARNLAERALSKKRFNHSKAVVKYAMKLASIHNLDVKKTAVAGYLHDIAKELSPSVLLQMINSSDIISIEEIKGLEQVWHSYAGGAYAKDVLELDEEISMAIASHTSGRAGMSGIEKVIYVSDYLSEDRNIPGLAPLRKLSERSLDSVVLEILTRQISRLITLKRKIDINSIRAYNYMLSHR
jgi:predicted HD superfamily hydrolase involved in NAD metabolism